MKDEAQAPGPAEKKPRRALTLEEREEKARQQAARAAQALAKVRAARKREELREKAAIGELVIAYEKRGVTMLEKLVAEANNYEIPVNDYLKTLAAEYATRFKKE